MPVAKVVFHGTPEEAYALVASIDSNCTCVRNVPEPTVCALHQSLLYNQRFVDGLLFMRRLSHRLLVEEWRSDTPLGTLY